MQRCAKQQLKGKNMGFVVHRKPFSDKGMCNVAGLTKKLKPEKGEFYINIP